MKGNGSGGIPTTSPAFGFEARDFKKLKIQPLFPPAMCVGWPERATSLLQLLLLAVVLGGEGSGGGPRMGSGCSDPDPCPGTTSDRGSEGLALSGLSSQLKPSISFEMV